jgi:hypothetical protein
MPMTSTRTDKATGPGIVLCLALAATLAACTSREAPILFDGQVYKAKASRVSDDDRTVQITVQAAAGREVGALQAARYEANRYCLERFGGSDLAWAEAEAGSEADLVDPKSLLTGEGSLVRTGRCEHR